MKEKSIGTAIVLNLVIPGLGYIYIGRWILGILAFIIMGAILFSSALTIVGLPFAWFFCGVIMALDMLILSRSKSKKDLKSMKACPYCAEMIQKAAVICKHCQKDLTKSEAV